MDDPSTPRHSIFAVWRWPRWTWFVIAPLLIAGYVVTAGSVYVALLIAAQEINNPLLQAAAKVYFKPAICLTDYSEWLTEFYNWQMEGTWFLIYGE